MLTFKQTVRKLRKLYGNHRDISPFMPKITEGQWEKYTERQREMVVMGIHVILSSD